MSSEQQIPGPEGGGAEHLVEARPADAKLGRALSLVRYLRRHCEWDARQTPESLRPYLLEEAHEVADAVLLRREEPLRAELGDLLLNIAFQIVLAEERGAFDSAGVVADMEGKMRRRHPHVYGDAEEAPDWERMKAEQRSGDATDAAAVSGSDPFEGLPAGLEPLSRSLRMQDRAAGLNFDWPDVRGALEKLEEEVSEVRQALEEARDGDGRLPATADSRVEDEIGDLLFAAVNVARLAGVHPSSALERAAAKFADRFRALLELAGETGLDPNRASLEELDGLWEQVKKSGLNPP